jgi:hypothetical protein
VVLPHKGADGGRAHVAAGDDVPEEGEGGDEGIGPAAGWAAHVGWVGRVEAKRGGGRAVGDEVDPEQVEGAENLGKAEEGGQEDGGNLADVAAAGRGGGKEGEEGWGVGMVKLGWWALHMARRGSQPDPAHPNIQTSRS